LPPAYGGAEVAAFRYAERLNKDPDSTVIVIGWDRTGAYQDSKVNYDFVHPVQFYENPEDAEGLLIYFQQLGHIWNCFRALVKPMWKYRNDYDYIHNFNSGFAFNRVSIFIGKILGKKVITETSLIGDDDPLSLGKFYDWKDYFKPKFLRYRFYKMADRFVSKSIVMTDIFKKSEIPMSKVAEIPYAVDIEKFSPADSNSKKELRSKNSIWEEGKIILFVGGINKRKGVHLLVDAFISIEKKIPSTRLIIAGPTYKYDQNYISDIKEKITKANIDTKVIMTENNVENVDEYMRSSDIFVLPSKQEGFPISIVEAMSCGLGVVASDIPEISKAQIDNDINGLVFEEGSHQELGSRLLMLLEDDNKVRSLGLKAREKAVNNWSTKIVDESYKKLYLSLS